MAEIIFFLSPFVAFACLLIGFVFKNYIFAIIGGLAFLSLSVVTFISPIPDLSSVLNTVLGSVYFAIGAYSFVVPTIEYIQELLN